jgi:hypothetical protein
MRPIALVLLSLTCSISFANQIEDSDYTTPSVELVTTIYEFCLEQHSTSGESDIESRTLHCVNSDLEISSYKTFKTHTELTSFISQEKGV